MLSQNVNRCEITPTGVCDEHKLIVEGDPERQIQMIRKDVVRFSMAFPVWIMKYHHLSGRGIAESVTNTSPLGATANHLGWVKPRAKT